MKAHTHPSAWWQAADLPVANVLAPLLDPVAPLNLTDAANSSDRPMQREWARRRASSALR